MAEIFSPIARNITSNTDDPTGFIDAQDEVTLSWDDGTRTLTLTATGSSYRFFIAGNLFAKASDSKQITDVTGDHWLYYDSTGTLQVDQGAFDIDKYIKDNVFVAHVLWNQTASKATLVTRETHGLMTWNVHSYLHRVFGSQYISGLGLSGFSINGNGSLDAHAQFACANGEITDEDVPHVITNGSPQTLSAIAQIPILYYSGSNWLLKTADNFPLIHDGTAGYTGTGGRAPYNNPAAGGSLVTVSNNALFLVHYFATGDIRHPIMGIQGQAEYATVAAAKAGALTEITSIVTTGLPMLEWVAIATVIFQTGTTYANTPQAVIRSTDTGANYVDWRETNVPASGATAGSGIVLQGYQEALVAHGTVTGSNSLNFTAANFHTATVAAGTSATFTIANWPTQTGTLTLRVTTGIGSSVSLPTTTWFDGAAPTFGGVANTHEITWIRASSTDTTLYGSWRDTA